ncbi:MULTISPECIES: NUDIX domain-containing protein [unclassified Streptomyces]|uniref:NUDIX domain-containing protein n=1 Tax=unclassified Streptomyces TaxID=2593676 RepID=UPI0037FC4853
MTASGRRIQPGGHGEATDLTLPGAVRREIAEETGITALEPLCGGEPVQIDVHSTRRAPIETNPHTTTSTSGTSSAPGAPPR